MIVCTIAGKGDIGAPMRKASASQMIALAPRQTNANPAQVTTNERFLKNLRWLRSKAGTETRINEVKPMTPPAKKSSTRPNRNSDEIGAYRGRWIVK